MFLYRAISGRTEAAACRTHLNAGPNLRRRSTEETVLLVEKVSKRYEIYEHPQDRLKQFAVPRLQRVLPLKLAIARPYYKEFWALRDFSVRLRRGDALGILGTNGAGKSTLLQIVAGTLAPTFGSVAVSGKVAALLELGSGFSPDFTGRENVQIERNFAWS